MADNIDRDREPDGDDNDIGQANGESERESSVNSLDEISDDNLLADRDSTDGCKHYARKCSFISPCCGKLYTCRICHNEEEDHEVDRFKVTEIQCLKCNKQQEASNKCTGCDVVFAEYFCSTCHLYDRDRQQFHCSPCGLCRVGGRENFFHCPVCDLCLSLSLKDSHKCIERASRSNCPVCMEDLHTSRLANNVLPCSHIMHMMCFRDMIKTANYACPICAKSMVSMDEMWHNYACPICAKSMVSMDEVWQLMDREVTQTEMPSEYRDLHVQILCRDCNLESRVKFHIVGLKCLKCGSYNTCRTAEREGTGTDDPGAEGGGDVAQ